MTDAEQSEAQTDAEQPQAPKTNAEQRESQQGRWWNRHITGLRVTAAIGLAGVGVALYSSISAQRSTSEQIELFRTQLESARPVIVPVVEARPRYGADSGSGHVTLKNVGSSAAVSGVVAAVPYGSETVREFGAALYPSCGRGFPEVGHEVKEFMPPIAPGETVRIEFVDAPWESAGPPHIGALCVTVGYQDVLGTQWLSDWVSTRHIGSQRTIWVATEFRSFAEDDPNWANRPDTSG